jgi:hypothetical protein
MQRFVAELRARPGSWAQYVTSSGDEWMSHSVRNQLKDYGCETRTTSVGRPAGKVKFCVWARWPE